MLPDVIKKLRDGTCTGSDSDSIIALFKSLLQIGPVYLDVRWWDHRGGSQRNAIHLVVVAPIRLATTVTENLAA